MPSTVETYRSAANEHLVRAQMLFEHEEYFLCHYIAGLAVECHLRAVLRRKKDTFDSRHNIVELAKESGYYDLVPLDELSNYSSYIALVNLRWRSNHRYCSSREFLDYMNDLRAEYNTKGDRWKNTARTLLNSASQVVALGEAQWKQN